MTTEALAESPPRRMRPRGQRAPKPLYHPVWGPTHSATWAGLGGLVRRIRKVGRKIRMPVKEPRPRGRRGEESLRMLLIHRYT